MYIFFFCKVTDYDDEYTWLVSDPTDSDWFYLCDELDDFLSDLEFVVSQPLKTAELSDEYMSTLPIDSVLDLANLYVYNIQTEELSICGTDTVVFTGPISNYKFYNL